jgi:hypothetical protein
MNKNLFYIKTILFLTLVMSMSGCAQSLRSIELDEAMITMLQSEVRIYEKDELEMIRYQIIKPVQAISCKKKPWGEGVSKEDAIDQLRYKAYKDGANALFRIFCEPEESIGLSSTCLSSVTCHGVAIKILPGYR